VKDFFKALVIILITLVIPLLLCINGVLSPKGTVMWEGIFASLSAVYAFKYDNKQTTGK